MFAALCLLCSICLPSTRDLHGTVQCTLLELYCTLHLEGRLLQLCVAEIKQDLKGKKEYEEYLAKLNIQKAELQERIARNQAWIVSMLNLH